MRSALRALKRYILIIIPILIALFIVKIYYDTNTIEIKYYTLKNSSLGAVLNNLKVAHLSDLHIKEMGLREKKILEILRKEKPDLILITGDYISFGGPYAPIMSFFSQLQAPQGIYAVMGNTEYYNENGSCVLCHNEKPERPLKNVQFYPRSRKMKILTAGIHLVFRGEKFESDAEIGQKGAFSKGLSKDLKKSPPFFLRNAAVELKVNGKPFTLAGVDDPVTKKSDLSAALRGVKPEQPCILLSHSPELFEEASSKGVDLVFSGHTHGGQILGFKVLQKFFPLEPAMDMMEGFFQKGRTLMYVTRGIGTSFLPFRLGIKPEITFFTFAQSSPTSSLNGGPEISNSSSKTEFSGFSRAGLSETINIFNLFKNKYNSRNVSTSKIMFDFESEQELENLNWECLKWFERSAKNATSGQHSLKTSLPPGQYPGINFKNFRQDWSGFKGFKMDVYNPSQENIRFHIRIDDHKSGWEYADRFDKTFSLAQGMNNLEISLDKLKTNLTPRPMNLKKIERMMVFIPNNKKPRELYVDNIRLE